MDTYVCVIVDNGGEDSFCELCTVLALDEDDAIRRAEKSIPSHWYVHTVAIITVDRYDPMDIVLEVL